MGWSLSRASTVTADGTRAPGRHLGPGEGGDAQEATRHLQPVPGGQSYEHVSAPQGCTETGSGDSHPQVERRDVLRHHARLLLPSTTVTIFVLICFALTFVFNFVLCGQILFRPNKV